MNSYYIKEQCWSISLYIIIIVKFIPFGRKCCSPSNSFWRKLSTLQKEAWRLDDLKSVVHSCISLMGSWWFMDKQYHTTMTFNQVWCVRSPFYEPVHDKIIFFLHVEAFPTTQELAGAHHGHIEPRPHQYEWRAVPLNQWLRANVETALNIK